MSCGDGTPTRAHSCGRTDERSAVSGSLRLWTLHPKYLDPQGLTALWREGLLAQKVLRGETKSYQHHPPLNRFTATRAPSEAIGKYLRAVVHEASRRQYRFAAAKIVSRRYGGKLTVSRGQLLYEWKRLKAKLRRRSPGVYRQVRSVKIPDAHPLFRIVPGPIADWERCSTHAQARPSKSAAMLRALGSDDRRTHRAYQ